MNGALILQNVTNILINVGLKLLAAAILFYIGRKVIGYIVNYLDKALGKQYLDPTVMRYVHSILSVTLNVVMVMAILGYLGVETTSFAALLASLGIAIGVAWSGLLSNFAAGAFIIVLQPFKVGDFITAGGVTGTVKEIGLFVTAFNTPDNVLTFVGNNKIFADNIQNYSFNPYRRVDLKAQLSHGVDPIKAINLLKAELVKIPNVLTEPAPDVELLEFNLAGPVLCVRPYCNNNHYWQVYFNTNQVIVDTFGAANFPVPEQHIAVRAEGLLIDQAVRSQSIN